jgi:hypothetical protein
MRTFLYYLSILNMSMSPIILYECTNITSTPEQWDARRFSKAKHYKFMALVKGTLCRALFIYLYGRRTTSIQISNNAHQGFHTLFTNDTRSISYFGFVHLSFSDFLFNLCSKSLLSVVVLVACAWTKRLYLMLQLKVSFICNKKRS